MNILAFDTSTEVTSIALVSDAGQWAYSGVGGAQTSATLIPAILGLMAQAGLVFGALDVIAFGRGPGSFTGLRTACSVAQGLGLGAGAAVRLLPIDTLLAVAEEARYQHKVTRVVALLDARMDEIYHASYDFDSGECGFDGVSELLKPEAVVCLPGWVMAGNAGTAYAARLPGAVLPALPTAAAMLRLAPALIAAGQTVSPDEALPRYIRDKVASTTDERAIAKALANTLTLANI